MNDRVLAAVRLAFPEAEHAAVLAAVERYGQLPHEPERERVQLAIVELSGGSMAKLLRWVHDAKIDYRDILASKQLGPLSAAQGEHLQQAARTLLDTWGKK